MFVKTTMGVAISALAIDAAKRTEVAAIRRHVVVELAAPGSRAYLNALKSISGLRETLFRVRRRRLSLFRDAFRAQPMRVDALFVTRFADQSGAFCALITTPPRLHCHLSPPPAVVRWFVAVLVSSDFLHYISLIAAAVSAFPHLA